VKNLWTQLFSKTWRTWVVPVVGPIPTRNVWSQVWRHADLSCGDVLYQNLFQSITGVPHKWFTSGIWQLQKWNQHFDRVSHARKSQKKSVLIMTKEMYTARLNSVRFFLGWVHHFPILGNLDKRR
jgi:hypothetical protein